MKSIQAKTDKLLSRGGVCFSLAAILCAHRLSQDSLVALSPQYRRSVAEIIAVVATHGDPAALARASKAAMGKEPATRLPSYTRRFDTVHNLERIGDTISLPPVLADIVSPADSAKIGVCIIGAAFCRSSDHTLALGKLLPGQYIELLDDAVAISGVLIAPGQPSLLKKKLQQLDWE